MPAFLTSSRPSSDGNYDRRYTSEAPGWSNLPVSCGNPFAVPLYPKPYICVMSSDVITHENWARLQVARLVSDIAKSMMRLSMLGRSIVPNFAPPWLPAEVASAPLKASEHAFTSRADSPKTHKSRVVFAMRVLVAESGGRRTGVP